MTNPIRIITMAKRKSSKRSKKKNNSFLIFFIVVIIIAIISFAITYVVNQSDSGMINEGLKVEEKVAQKEISKSTGPLDGTWASYNNGAMLTIIGRNFTIELPNVDATVIASGTVVIKDNVITFIDTSDFSQCKIKSGNYNFSIGGKDEVTFTKIEDSCDSRAVEIEATWFKV